jgi:multicomponent Na+:H+ antiporter subunit A
MGLGGCRALRQHDLKLLLAFGTVSQLGFLFLLIASGEPKLLYGGLALLTAHALFKAALFMIVGTIDHEAGTRDLRRLSNLRASMPAVFVAGTMAAFSMAAVPLTFGFAAKEAAFDGLLGRSPALVALTAAVSVLTVVYTGRFLLGAFGAHHEGHEPAGREAHTPRNMLAWSPLVLASAGVALGLAPGPMAGLVDGASRAVSGFEKAGKLVVWPGAVPALGWSLASLTVGAVLVWRSRLVDAATGRVALLSRRLPTADGSYRRSIAGLLTFADRSSTLIQNGSLPWYIGVIALVGVALPASALIGGPLPTDLPPTGGILETLLALLIVASAGGLVFIGRRFAAVILLGGVGYGVAGLYAVLGGPDLSLTQLLVETLAIALFALVLRHLPATFTKPRTPQLPRVLIAALVGVFVFFGGLLTAGTRSETPVSDRYLASSVPEAGGANVVNVILVDFRGFDTLGEITVLATAALGAAGLVIPLLRRRRRETS